MTIFGSHETWVGVVDGACDTPIIENIYHFWSCNIVQSSRTFVFEIYSHLVVWVGTHTPTSGAYLLPVYTLTGLQIGSILVCLFSLRHTSLGGPSCREQEGVQLTEHKR